MSSENTQTATNKRGPRLTPNERAQIISDFNAGKAISNPNYYVIKSKKGVLNVRKIKEEIHKEHKKKEAKTDEGCLTIKQGDSIFKIPMDNYKYSDGYLTIDQGTTLFKIPAKEIIRKKKEQKKEQENTNIPVKEPEEKEEKEEKPRAL